MTPNLVIPNRPTPAGQAVVLANPAWLRAAFRILLLLCGPILLYVSLASRSSLPLPGTILAAVVGTGTFLLAVWQRPWARFELFIADEKGIHFPANDLLAVQLGRTDDVRWLFVPWANIANVRTARTRGDMSSCVAFDVRVTPEERASFFGRVDEPADRANHSPTTVFAAFDINPPSPNATAARLLALCDKSDNSGSN